MTKILSLQMSVVLTEEYNVRVNSEKQIDITRLNNEIT